MSKEKETFEKNGGYFIDGVAYMDCKITGEPVPNVATDIKSVIGSRALNGIMAKQFPVTEKPKYKPTGRPAGWHWMAEFVDKDGNVFHKGKEQPDLKGTLPPTKVKPRKKKKKLSADEKLQQDIKNWKKRKKLRRGKTNGKKHR